MGEHVGDSRNPVPQSRNRIGNTSGLPGTDPHFLIWIASGLPTIRELCNCTSLLDRGPL